MHQSQQCKLHEILDVNQVLLSKTFLCLVSLLCLQAFGPYLFIYLFISIYLFLTKKSNQRPQRGQTNKNICIMELHLKILCCAKQVFCVYGLHKIRQSVYFPFFP